MLNRKVVVILVLILSLAFWAKKGFCFDESTVCGLKEVGFISGWAHGDLKDGQQDYEMVLSAARFGWNIKPWLKFIQFPSKSLFEFVLEPYVNTVTSPDSNAEIGSAFFFKYGHPIIGKKLLAYLEFGSGMQYGTQHVLEQSTQFNFASAAGGGFYYFIKDDLALNLGYRFRHMSNAGIDEPNSGVNTQHYIAGISWLF